MILETVVVGELAVNCYILGCEKTRQGVVIDPGDEPSAIEQVLRKHGLTPVRLLATHAHFDHTMAARRLQETTGAPFYIHRDDRLLLTMMMAWMGMPGEPPQVNGDLVPGEVIRIGEIALEVRLTPGHSPGSVTFVDHAGRRAFTGDALFAGGVGRTDFPGGHWQTLLGSIRGQILTLPDDYQVLPGHGPSTTVGEERQFNPYLDGDGLS